MDKIAKNLRTFRLHAIVAIIALVMEFILGMYTALFVEFPESLANGNAWAWSMSKSFMTTAHVVLGTLLIAISLATLRYGIIIKSKAAIATSATGLAMVFLAAMSGFVFLADISKDVFSFSMALSFIGALLAYGFAYHLAQSPLRSDE